jgi:exosortase E/protease (VPEID-CTERM system)
MRTLVTGTSDSGGIVLSPNAAALDERTSQLSTFPHSAHPESNSSQTPFFSMPRNMLPRLFLLALLLGLECLLRSSLPHTETFLAPVASFGIATFAVFFGLGYSVVKEDQQPLPFRRGFFLAHLVALAALCLESFAAATGHEPLGISPALLFALRSALTLATALLLALALLPIPAWIRLRRATGLLWLYAILAGALTSLLRSPLQSLWTSQDFLLGHWLQSATFTCVAHLLTPIVPGLQVDASGYILSAPNFAIFVAPACSGLEGLGLVLVFTLLWLFWFRREFLFPHALLLVPISLVAVWLLNVVRIAALMLIGNAGSPEIALTGFHSQAGWIAFTLVALSFSVATRHLRWAQRNAPAPAATSTTASIEARGESAATPAYLLPFLAILATSFFTRAASGAFEWLYPLRLVIALIALWCFRKTYRTLSFRFHWTAILAGLAVFLLWIAPGLSSTPPSSAIPAGLAQLLPSARLVWIAFRIAAAVITVPITEELAFRGFLARRLTTRNFDSVPLAHLTLVPILISSLAFGLLHGSHWLPGIIAGIVFALLARYRNRLGDAIAAHATANLLLAIWVLARGDFGLW